MDQATYDRLRGAVEEECRRKIEALDVVAALWREHEASGPGPEAGIREGEPGVLIEDPEQEEPEEPEGEPSKPCKECGESKPLPEFPQNKGYRDGHTNKCKPCTREYQQRKAAESKERAAAGRSRSEVRELRPKEERRCANGSSCAAVDPDDLVPTPAILDGANPGPLCRRCQRRAGVA